MNGGDSTGIRRSLVVGLAVILVGATLPAIVFAHDTARLENNTEEVLRSALVESLQDQVAQICKEMSCEPPSVSVTADLSEILRAFPEKLGTSLTVRCHPVPCVAVTAQTWPHLMEVYAKSDEGVRRISLDVGLSRQENAMTLASATVKSTEDYARPKISPAINGEKKLRFDLCGVGISLKNSQQYVVDVGGHRLGAVFEGEGELTLEATCAKSRRMLVDFIPKPNDPIKVSRVFISCPFQEKMREPREIERLRHRVQQLKEGPRTESDQPLPEWMAEFVGDCVKSVYPLTEEEALQGLAPHAGYEHPMLVVQTEELGAFGFCFAGERGSEAVMMTSPWTGRPVSYWESSGTHRKWVIPDAQHYAFHVAWHPEDLGVDVQCEISVSGVERGRDIRFMLNSPCKAQNCRVNGENVQFTHGTLTLDEAIASALACGYHPMYYDGFLQLFSSKTPIDGGQADVSVEYSLEYTDSSVIETSGRACVCEDGLSLDGQAPWYPFARFRSEAPWAGGMAFEAEVPAGFMAIAQGDPEPVETKDDRSIWRYTADFPTTMPSLSIGRFEAFVDDEFEPKLVVLTPSGEAVGRRWLDALRLVVPWAEKYSAEYPYKRFAIVQTTPGDFGSTSWPMVLTMNCMVNPDNYCWMFSHEVAHQWWANAARMLDIDDVWLHEGTATYFNVLFVGDLNVRNLGVGGAFKTLGAKIRRFEAPPPMSAGFRMGRRCGKGTFLYHLKGAYIYHMLRMATNNDRHFFATLKQYQAEAQKVGLTEAGLKAAFEKAIGHDLSGLFSLYVHSGELPGVQVEVTDVKAEGDHATISLPAQITPGGYQLPYPIDVFRKSGLAPHRAVVFIGPDFGDYKIYVPFSDISRIVGNPEAMLLVAQPEQEDVELWVSPE
ncbi:MAG: hypothetical protein JW759_07575 [Candidatus Coatesbacteria bacterium]|nr:hypothetical protein [Candidatus Coatesbacteria bacterium]